MGLGFKRGSLGPLVLRVEEVLARYRRRAVKLGITNCEGGALVFQHRFGGSLNLNTHLHAVVVDGVFERTSTSDNTERARFHPLPPPQPVELTAIAFDVYRKFEAGDVQCSQEQADEMRFALRKSPHASEFGGFSIHARCDRACRKQGRPGAIDSLLRSTRLEHRADERYS
jgi:hypothetical protein